MTDDDHNDNEYSISDAKMKAIKTLTITMGFVLIAAIGFMVYMIAGKGTANQDTMTEIEGGIIEHALSLPAGAIITQVTTAERRVITHYKNSDGTYGVDMYDTYTGKTQRVIIK